ncbi:MAG: hypothetical protein AAF458_07715 [Pseudomonadota bacterium]
MSDSTLERLRNEALELPHEARRELVRQLAQSLVIEAPSSYEQRLRCYADRSWGKISATFSARRRV